MNRAHFVAWMVIVLLGISFPVRAQQATPPCPRW